jgi:diguanylate cyclase (GGDEF)-like protein
MTPFQKLLFFGLPTSKITSSELKDRVNVERAKIYFGHTLGSLIALIVGLVIAVILLYILEVSLLLILLWALSLGMTGVVLFRFEHSIKNKVLTPSTIYPLISKRLMISFAIALIWGLFIQLIPESSKLGYTFAYIAMSTFINIGFLSYAIIPIHFLITFIGVLVPLQTTLFSHYRYTSDPFFVILALTFIVCEGILFVKAVLNAKTSIKAIVLNEQLKDEISKYSKAQEHIEFLAYHDHLTGCWNRRYVEKHLLEHLNNGASLGIILLDINYFKPINDTYGHNFGDELLVQFAKTLENALPSRALLGRLGGDEFIVVLEPCHSFSDLEAEAKRCKRLLKKTYAINSIELDSSASVGWAMAPAETNEIDTLIHLADERMYADKKIDHQINA